MSKTALPVDYNSFESASAVRYVVALCVSSVYCFFFKKNPCLKGCWSKKSNKGQRKIPVNDRIAEKNIKQ
jgi:hypothetical protein